MPARARAIQASALFLTILWSLAGPSLRAEPSGPAVTYVNPKYGFALTLPTDVFAPDPVRTREEGGVWESLDGNATLLAGAAPNDAGASLSEYRRFVMQQSYPGAAIDYAPVRDTWFVLSGVQSGRIFYERVNFACDGRYIYGWQLTYPEAERRRYDAVVEAIHRSFRAGRGEDGRCGRTSRGEPQRGEGR